MILDSNDVEDVARRLTEDYDNCSIGVSDLEQTLPFIDSRESLIEALHLLESTEAVYIERNPRIEDGVVRKDLRYDDIVYFNSFPGITRRSLLYKTRVEYGDYTINHILGCAHGCQYPCYAMQISRRYGRISDYEDWMHPRLVNDSLNLLDKELPKLNSHISFIHLSFMTDPFMYDVVNSRTYSWIRDLTLKIIKRLNEENLRVTVLTKGLYPSKLSEEQFNRDNEYGITLVSLDSEFHNKYEPYSAPPQKRLDALESLHESGLTTWVSIEPYPSPNIIEQSLDDLLQSVSFVDKMIFGRWNYNPEVNGHKGVLKFYRECSRKVSDFCGENDIMLHIKHGTPLSSVKSNGLFHG